MKALWRDGRAYCPQDGCARQPGFGHEYLSGRAIRVNRYWVMDGWSTRDGAQVRRHRHRKGNKRADDYRPPRAKTASASLLEHKRRPDMHRADGTVLRLPCVMVCPKCGTHLDVLPIDA